MGAYSVPGTVLALGLCAGRSKEIHKMLGKMSSGIRI